MLNFYFYLQQGGEEEKIKRPEVRDEDLVEARDKLAFGTTVKSKTFEVMEECGRYRDDYSNKHCVFTFVKQANDVTSSD